MSNCKSITGRRNTDIGHAVRVESCLVGGTVQTSPHPASLQRTWFTDQKPLLRVQCRATRHLVQRSLAEQACDFRPSPFPGSNSYLFPSLPLSLHPRIPSISRASTQGATSRRPSPSKTDRSNIPSCYHPSSRVSPPPMLILVQSPTPPRTSYTETWPTNQSHHTLSMSPYLQGIPRAQSSSQLPTPNRLFPQSEPHHWSVTVHPPAAQHTHIPS
ncbi:hypothetical protein K456DRAFT_794028 [Colletotrichum gloeosporioides 23]|nr:hypothetical protein K456DRAFT_794028 [Colletotrichum gloeosporioides 23]